jgi:hypothetical protein
MGYAEVLVFEQIFIIFNMKKLYNSKKFQFPTSTKVTLRHKLRILTNPLTSYNYYPITFGFGFKAVQGGFLSIKHFEALRKILSMQQYKSFSGRLYLCPTFLVAKTKKNIGSTMGSGKGEHNMEVLQIQPGSIFLIILGVTHLNFLKLYRGLIARLPLRVSVCKLY